MSSSPPAAAADRESGCGQLLAVERRAVEEIRELGAVALRRRAPAARPREAPRPRSPSPAATVPRRRLVGRPRSPPCPPSASRPGSSRSSARWASRPAVRASSGIAFAVEAGKPRSRSTAAIGSETFIVSGRPQTRATASRSSRAIRTCCPLTPRSSASSRMRSARGSSGRWTGWPNPGALRRRRGSPGRARRRRRLDRRRPRPARCASSSSRAHTSVVPSTTGPQPRIPAATAPWSEPGSAASVIRAATFVGIIPCSAIATRSRSRK